MIYNKEITICKSNQFLPNKNLLYNIYENSISEKREIIFVFQRICLYISGMDINTDIFKIETNHVLPSRGKVLISGAFPL